MGSKKYKHLVTLSFRLVIAALLVYFIVQKVSLEDIQNAWKQFDIWMLLLALIPLHLSHITAGLRLGYYAKKAGAVFSPIKAIKLYYIGIGLSHLLPGGLSGDGYKAYIYVKELKLSLATAVRQQLSNRGNGMLWTLLYSYIFIALSGIIFIANQTALLIGSVLITIVAYHLIAKLLLKESTKSQLGASVYSALSQIMLVLSMSAILYGFGVVDIKYLILFLVANIVYVLPISIGGIGLREIVFLYGAPLLGLDAMLGVSAALTYYLLNLISALIGVTLLTVRR